MVSAIQKANQPCEIPKVLIKIHRHGTRKTSWRIAALTMLMTPFPSPEAKYPHRIVTAARTKVTEMMRRAGIAALPRPLIGIIRIMLEMYMNDRIAETVKQKCRGSERRFRQLRDKNTVNNIVKRLYKQRQHQRSVAASVFDWK